jgi:hypothetical protein
MTVMLECCEQPRNHHSAVYEKYSDKRYKRAAIFVESEMQKGFCLPSPKRDSMGNHTGHSSSWRRK